MPFTWGFCLMGKMQLTCVGRVLSKVLSRSMEYYWPSNTFPKALCPGDGHSPWCCRRSSCFVEHRRLRSESALLLNWTHSHCFWTMEERAGTNQDPGNMAVSSHWIQTQHTDTCLCLTGTGR
ncbi:hypothetical protein AGOR_G00100500 [Albula goreensis]|uniref:Uncharacterized protein n=1 Tax=Albula goreensis TaxID=1534307 RepID=A0A8T3DLJ6_9TELE|nr:hypothetical protein AGOR_G00100500 [Albula goreensis]